MKIGGARGGVAVRDQGDEQDLKLNLHRYLVESIEEDEVELSSWVRGAVLEYVREKVAQYVAGHQLPLTQMDLDRLAEDLVDELTGLGPLQALLSDPSVSEILVNGAQHIVVEREGRLEETDRRFIDDAHVRRVIERILAPLGRRLDEASPMVDGRLPDGSRVNAVIPPVAMDGPSISIRKFKADPLQGRDLVVYGTLNEELLSFLRNAVERRANILVSGGTSTGKTTLLNVLSGFIGDSERVVTIEDTGELQLGHRHVVRLETRPPNVEGFGEVTARDLVKNALRMRPDRIVLGEVRGDEVMDMMQAMNTGHDGSMSTIHANSASDALLRMEALFGMAGRQIQEATVRQMIGAAVDVIVQLVRLPNGRRCISEVAEVVSVRDGHYVTNVLFELDRAHDRIVHREGAPASGKLRRN
ncbi:CpaF family protein [Thioalkalivibrio sp. ALR17-21]|uniref:CpaF family protein n=1 Tax=Thioalkalivibrio sp. ALR17-21 TaxID=1269813 RepID=UPI00041D738E|nr:CpaF family protein [Thioalkalivibrio sp. ALR17-21]